MYFLTSCIIITIIFKNVNSQYIYETDMNFRVDPGSRTCFFEHGQVGQMMEVHYEVLDGQHGDLDISFDILDPNGVKLLSDYKKSQNTFLMELEHEGEYVFCLDNSYSIMNSKLVFVDVLIENKNMEEEPTVVEGEELEEIVQWTGVDEAGVTYYIDVTNITESLMRTLKSVGQARHQLERYGAMKSRDSYTAFEDTFIVDVWSGFQITFMFIVGMIQVYMIKKLFNSPCYVNKY
ncbi:PREDICTED: transmembrane emp24 domain-containing protein 1-like [Papilio polytes]|uniref:transmembrane emp24 domain-containing protein 1-like n=1 Tax=Papilio polytes TaxID=76194 RepID=UPI0006765AEA|nr:PREDICTED: transmembrane emp24 domain-containing protein 1-like [Papilio polytes]